MEYIYRINNNDRVSVNVWITRCTKIHQSGIFAYKMAITIKRVETGKEIKFDYVAYSNSENYTRKMYRKHVDNIMNDIVAMYHLGTHGLHNRYNTEVLMKSQLVTDEYIRNFMLQARDIKDKIGTILEGGFRVTTSLNKDTNLFFDTQLAVYTGATEKKATVYAIVPDKTSAKHVLERSFMKNTHKIDAFFVFPSLRFSVIEPKHKIIME